MRGTVALAFLLLPTCTAVRAQESEIDQLKAQVIRLREQLERVEAKLNALEAKSSEPARLRRMLRPKCQQFHQRRNTSARSTKKSEIATFSPGTFQLHRGLTTYRWRVRTRATFVCRAMYA